MSNFWRRFWIVPPLVVAAGLFVLLPKFKTPPAQVVVSEKATPVRVLEAQPMPLVAKAVGFGRVTPARTWEAVAEVEGSVVWLADGLKTGALIKAGQELLRIDPESYAISLEQAESELAALDIKAQTQQQSLKLESSNLVSVEAEWERKRNLAGKGVVSQSELENMERELIRARAAVQNIRNALALTQADKAVVSSRVKNARLQLARTIIKAPFDARVTQRQVSEGQYANRGQPLFSADGVEAAEIEARFPIGRLRPLIASRRQAEEGATTSSPEQRQPGATKLQASVRLRTADHTVEWPARVDRASGMVDPKTQTMGVVVVVDEPYAQAKPGARPPLVRNTFVEVELRKPARGKPLVLPSSALREGKVYLANAENRLEVRKIKPAFVQDGAVAIAKGLEAGERVLIRPPVPAVEGMLLDVIMDEKAAKKLRKQVEGQPKSGSGKSAS